MQDRSYKGMSHNFAFDVFFGAFLVAAALALWWAVLFASVPPLGFAMTVWYTGIVSVGVPLGIWEGVQLRRDVK